MGQSNAEAVIAAIDGGTTFVQLREKDAPGGRMLAEARAVIAVARPRGVRALPGSGAHVALLASLVGCRRKGNDAAAWQADAELGIDQEQCQGPQRLRYNLAATAVLSDAAL